MRIELQSLEVVMGISLLILAWLVFSIWKDRLHGVKEEERAHFLMYDIRGGAWIVSVFALCGGFYFLLQPLVS